MRTPLFVFMSIAVFLISFYTVSSQDDCEQLEPVPCDNSKQLWEKVTDEAEDYAWKTTDDFNDNVKSGCIFIRVQGPQRVEFRWRVFNRDNCILSLYDILQDNTDGLVSSVTVSKPTTVWSEPIGYNITDDKIHTLEWNFTLIGNKRAVGWVKGICAKPLVPTPPYPVSNETRNTSGGSNTGDGKIKDSVGSTNVDNNIDTISEFRSNFKSLLKNSNISDIYFKNDMYLGAETIDIFDASNKIIRSESGDIELSGDPQDSKYLIIIDHSHYIDLTGFTFDSENLGIMIKDSDHIKIRKNVFNDIFVNSVYICGGNNNSVEDNSIEINSPCESKDLSGIFVNNSNHNHIIGNEINANILDPNLTGIWISNGDRNVLNQNIITGLTRGSGSLIWICNSLENYIDFDFGKSDSDEYPLEYSVTEEYNADGQKKIVSCTLDADGVYSCTIMKGSDEGKKTEIDKGRNKWIDFMKYSP